MCSNITPLNYVHRLDLPNFFLHLDSGFNVNVTEKLLGSAYKAAPIRYKLEVLIPKLGFNCSAYCIYYH